MPATTGLIYGYCRVSTRDQTTEQQEAELLRAGVDIVVHEKVSGIKRRPKLEELLDEVASGDEVWVTRLDRLARNVIDLDRIATKLFEKQVVLQFGAMRYDPTDAVSRMMFQQLSVIAEFERNLIASRTQEKHDYMRSQGMQVGRPRITDEKQDAAVYKLYGDGYSYSDLRKATGLSNSVLFRIVKEGEAQEQEAADPTIRRVRKSLEVSQKRARAKDLSKLAELFAKPSEGDAAQ